MDQSEWLAERSEEHRPRLGRVAYRMLGSLTEADDAVRDAWLRLSRSEADQLDNLGGWLTTVVARECLHMLRSRRRRREDFVGDRLPDPVVTLDQDLDPEQEALLGDSVGLALLVMLDSLTRPSGWRSCSTTCSSCPSSRSRAWSSAAPPPHGSWPAGRDAACRVP
jgi:DNA-directed RNA polymerase specialized sigma24 family protein